MYAVKGHRDTHLKKRADNGASSDSEEFCAKL